MIFGIFICHGADRPNLRWIDRPGASRPVSISLRNGDSTGGLSMPEFSISAMLSKNFAVRYRIVDRLILSPFDQAGQASQPSQKDVEFFR
jgi:hypothetical protein